MSIKKILVGLAAASIFGIVVLFLVFPVLSQGPALPPGEYDLEAGQYMFNVPELAPTNTPVPGPTDTPVPPPTDTPVPSAHNDTEWHPVSADISHTHNADPNSVNHIFGPPGAWHNGQEISYPWQTWQGLDADPLGPSSGIMENDIKHEGYKWFVRDGACDNNVYAGVPGNCIPAFRMQLHATGGAVGATTRLHSYSVELQICTLDLATCGILRGTGGHADYGPLSLFSLRGTPFDITYLPLPDDPPEFTTHSVGEVPYKHHRQLGDEGKNENISNWQSDGKFGWNQFIAFAFSNKDDFQGIDPNDPSRVELICPDLDCNFNHSKFLAYRVFFNKTDENPDFEDDALDGVLDGVINFDGFVDRQGHIVPACAPLGPDCIPLIMENVPVGRAVYSVPNKRDAGTTEFDLSPPGEFWIGYPN